MTVSRLGVNVDHVATVRNARGGTRPDPVRAALAAAEAGCDGITAHLREDRRHIRDADVAALKRELSIPLNLEMAATEAMLRVALAVRPHAACVVPEKREERTTEGGLDVLGALPMLRPIVRDLGDAGIRVSLFVEPAPAALDAARDLGAPVVELHTGRWCDLLALGHAAEAAREFERLRAAAERAVTLGLECHVGHGLDYASAQALAALPEVAEFNIGHFLIGEAIVRGLPEAVRLMRAAIARGRGEVDA